MNIGEVSKLLRPHIKDLLLFIHAFAGCDTTSTIYEKGKGSLIKLLDKSIEAQKTASCFLKDFPSQEEIGSAGHDIFVLLYNGNKEDSLHELRYRNYMRMAASASNINPSKLPPTKRTTYFHSVQVRLQVS